MLQRLGGVYRDPTRVSRDATRLQGSVQGRALKPTIQPLVQNDGSRHAAVLTLTGTISMNYRCTDYNIPVDIYLPPAYPLRPPIVFVRPVATMMLKENHRHVGSDGMVYMPYLHEWRQHSCDLVEMTIMLSSIFGADPPVYAKPPGAVAAVAAAVTHQPPRYNAVAAQVDQQRVIEQQRQQRVAQERREREEAEAAVAAVVAAKASEAADETRTTQQCRANLTRKLQIYLQNFYNEARADISADLRNQAKVEQGKNIATSQLEALKKAKEVLNQQTQHVEDQTVKVKEFIKEEGSREEPEVDDLAVPVDVPSKQMLELSAKNAAITDCLYFLDKALVRGNIPLDVHLKQVRKLGKTQFLTRAHLIKIANIQAGGQD